MLIPPQLLLHQIQRRLGNPVEPEIKSFKINDSQQLDRYFCKKIKDLGQNYHHLLKAQLRQRELQILEEACQDVIVQHLNYRSQRC